jgi:opacity protein-like surface antigen
MMLKTFVAAAAVAAALIVPATAQSAASPDGVWKDRWGTTFTFQLCGDGTQLCGTLNDIQGDSRTEANLAFVNQQVVQGERTAQNKWEGQLALNGGKAKAIVELIGPDTLKITGCRILCSSIDYQRVS